jgi:putative copper resistance protein D
MAISHFGSANRFGSIAVAGGKLSDALIWVRGLHFAATLSVAGAIFFRTWIVAPALRAAPVGAGMSAVIRVRLAWIAWTSLALMVVTAVAWLLVQTGRMSDLPFTALFPQAISTVLAETDFGATWLVRLVLALLLAGTLLFESVRPEWRFATALSVLLAAALAGSLAFAGHAAASTGLEGSVHLVADILHLVAASAWVGALVPLAVLLATARQVSDASIAVARAATLRFSTMGIASAATIFASGIVNSFMLVDSVSALTTTAYGRLLLLKVLLFLLMLSVAAINRLYLTPRLVAEAQALARDGALRQLCNNSLIEAAIAAIILIIVGAMGTLPPGTAEA